MGLRGHDSKLFKRRFRVGLNFRLDVRKLPFFSRPNRVINSWSSLPTQCVKCNSIQLILLKVCFCCTGIGNRRE